MGNDDIESAGKFTASLYVTQTVDVPNPPGQRGMDKRERRKIAAVTVQADTLEDLKEKLSKHVEIL